MSRVRNADEFLLKARSFRQSYETIFGPLISELRTKYVESPLQSVPDATKSLLEYHARCYLVNGILAALNWRLDSTPLDGLPSLVEEMPIRSHQRNTIRSLDYLGIERETQKPLLLVETKRPSADLPRLVDFNSSSLEEEPLSAISRGLKGERLQGEWSDWLSTIGDYVRSLEHKSGDVPRRVLVTNGEWMIAFLDPRNAFIDEGAIESSWILICHDWNQIEESHTELFNELEHSRVVGRCPPLRVGEVSFHLARDDLHSVLHGLRLRYAERPSIYNRWPTVSVAPVLHLRSCFGLWLIVEKPGQDFFVPESHERLREHLSEVEDAASDLLTQVSQSLGLDLVPVTLTDHYESDHFDLLPGVKETHEDQFLLVTGESTHYLRLEPTAKLSLPFLG